MRTDFGQGAARAEEILVQADGKIVAAGGGAGSYALVRYNVDGSLDQTFAGGGMQTSPGGVVTGLALQPDGKIVAAWGDGAFVVARYNPDGSPDQSFSGDGMQAIGFDRAEEVQVSDLALQRDGKVVVAGSALRSGGFILARLEADGSLDASFSDDGKVMTDFPAITGNRPAARAVAVGPDGRIVVGGNGALARYHPNGSLDPGFSGDGTQTTARAVTDIALQSDGKILAAGHAGADLEVGRFNHDGSPDPSFAHDGTASAGFATGAISSALVVHPDGKIAAVGAAAPVPQGARTDLALARFNNDGSLDPSFSGDGRQSSDFGGKDYTGASDTARAVALQDDGRLVVAGASGDPPAFTVVRYGGDGSLDTSFSSDGRQTADLRAQGLDIPHATAMQRDGGLVVAGSSEGAAALARYTRDGALDPSFSNDGKQLLRFAGERAEARALCVQRDGKIVMSVTRYSYPRARVLLVRYDADGSVDRSFSGDGIRYSTTSLDALAQQRDGRLVAVGGFARGFALARYKPDGTLDRSFSGDGKRSTKIRGGAGSATSVGIGRDGRIVVAGVLERDGDRSDLAIARYRRDGSLDRSFSRDGRDTTDLGFYDSADSVIVRRDGGVVLVGSSTLREQDDGASGAPSAIVLVRYRRDGSLNRGFSGDGKQLTRLGVEFAETDAVAHPDGRFVVGATARKFASVGFALARYHPDGSLDKSFSRDGKRISRLDGEWYAAGVVRQPEGRIVIAARGGEAAGLHDFGLVGYQGGSPADARPRVGGLSVSPARLGPSETARLRFRLSERARVRITIERRVGARRVRNVRVGRLRGAGRAGRNTVRLSGVVGLAPGSYRASLKAIDRRGYVSRVKRTKFRVDGL